MNKDMYPRRGWAIPSVSDEQLERVNADLRALIDAKRATRWKPHPCSEQYPSPIDNMSFNEQRQRARQFWKGQGR